MIKQTHTMVVEYDHSPEYHLGMPINGGHLVAIDFCGNRLRIEQKLIEALQALLQGCTTDDTWRSAGAEEALRRALEVNQ
ncbi:MAG: hypothetical protein L0L05_06795 [Yaniella sp.]|nr:hypothetical protein [Yaniella sp.]